MWLGMMSAVSFAYIAQKHQLKLSSWRNKVLTVLMCLTRVLPRDLRIYSYASLLENTSESWQSVVESLVLN